MPVGDKIRNARKKEGMTQAELAEKLGVKNAAISKYENGLVSPTMEQLHNIADVLNTTVSELVWEGEGSAPDSLRLALTPDGVQFRAEDSARDHIPDDGPADIQRLIDAYNAKRPLYLNGEQLSDAEAELFIKALSAPKEFLSRSKKNATDDE